MQNNKKIKQKHSIIKRKTKPVVTYSFDEKQLKTEILLEAKKLHLAESTAEMIVNKVVANVTRWAEKRAAVTLDDVNRRVALEMAKYDADLSYVYQNRGKII